MNYDNKYSKWYDDLIKQAQQTNRQRSDGAIYENHHIRPKSLGGKNSISNLVLLTPREHFIAHLLLFKMTEGSQKKAMLRALVRMLTFGKNSKKYDFVRQLIAKNSCGENNCAFGKIWVYNPDTLERKFVNQEEFESFYKNQGFVKGLVKQIGGFPRGTKIIINNKRQEKMIDKNTAIPNGWIKGRLNPPSKSHMQNMRQKNRDKDGHKKHSECLKGRISVINNDGEVKRIKKEDLEQYKKNGFAVGSGHTKNMRRISINGIIYKNLNEAAKKHNMQKYIINYRAKSSNQKWENWFYLDQSR